MVHEKEKWTRALVFSIIDPIAYHAHRLSTIQIVRNITRPLGLGYSYISACFVCGKAAMDDLFYHCIQRILGFESY